MRSKVITCVFVGISAYIGYRAGIVLEKERKKQQEPQVYMSAVPWEYGAEAERAAAHVAGVTGDCMQDVEIRGMMKFDDCRVYVVDSDFKIYGCVIDNNDSIRVSDRVCNMF